MANQEQVKLLKQGLAVWNAWRQEHPEVRRDLSRVNLSGATLSGADLSYTSLSYANLSGAGLSGAILNNVDLRYANLSGADLSGAILSNTTLSYAKLGGADFSGANLSGADLSEADLSGANLSGANLREADLSEANLRGANLSGANLSEATLSEANLTIADLSGAEISGADLSEAEISGANLSNVNLSEAYLSGAYLAIADLRGANLSEADLSGANLSEVNLSGANLSNANLHKTRLFHTILAAIDLCRVNGLATIIHEGPSSVDIKTVLLPEGETRIHFLRGVGFSDTFIDSRTGLLTAPRQYTSCFISYADQDEDLAQRLYKDLQDTGIRCWMAPHHLKPEEYFLAQINQAIQMPEKLVLILSKDALASKWVKYEVNRALHQEGEQERTILFPIRLDATSLQTTREWGADLRDRRHRGNFSSRKGEEGYQEAFLHLLSQLKIVALNALDTES